MWRSTRDGGPSWITRDGELGGLTDQRQSTGWNAREERIATSVSGNEAELKHQDASWKAFGADEIENKNRAKLVSEAQLALVGPAFHDRRFHDLTVWSAGLPVNVREGGWRRDLTAFMASGSGSVPDPKQGQVSLPGLRDSDNLIGDTDMTGQDNRFSEVVAFRRLKPEEI